MRKIGRRQSFGVIAALTVGVGLIAYGKFPTDDESVPVEDRRQRALRAGQASLSRQLATKTRGEFWDHGPLIGIWSLFQSGFGEEVFLSEGTPLSQLLDQPTIPAEPMARLERFDQLVNIDLAAGRESQWLSSRRQVQQQVLDTEELFSDTNRAIFTYALNRDLTQVGLGAGLGVASGQLQDFLAAVRLDNRNDQAMLVYAGLAPIESLTEPLSDGGYGSSWDSTVSSTATTAFVIQAQRRAVGRESESAVNYLLASQLPDGGFAENSDATLATLIDTAEAVAALS